MSSKDKPVIIYTDGACSGNPGPGGWGYYLHYKGAEKTMSGGAGDTTNNRMELTAAIEALNALTRPCHVTLHTDSSYVKNGIQKWMDNWKARGWRTASKKPVKNEDLWRALDEASNRHTDIKWVWVKGHSGNPGNEKADELANEGMAPFKAAVNG